MPYNGGNLRNPNVTPIVPVDTAVQFWVNNNNCQIAEPIVNLPNNVQSDNSTVEFFKFTDCDCDADFFFYKIINGGHTWPGVPIQQFPQLGNTNEDIHASFLLLGFFQTTFFMQDYYFYYNQLQQIQVKIFPNPVHSTLSISSDITIELVEIFNYQGNKLLELNPGFTEFKIDLSTIPLGTYIVNLTTKSNKKMSRKIIKTQ